MGKRNKGKRNGQMRTAAKTEKKEAKRAARIQQRYEAEIQAFLEKELMGQKDVSADDVPRPSARAHCSLVGHPTDGKTLIMFGGSVMRRGRIHTYRDMYKFRVDKRIWCHRISTPMPLPRCSHQCVTLRYGGKDLMYLYGGEYTTPDGEKFRHFGGKELWVCDLGRDTWELVSVTNELDSCPSPRSGHRMAVWGKTLVLFGGYYSAGEVTRYFNDLWLFDLDTSHWERAEFPSGALLPDPRSGCQIAVYEDMLYVFGGFARSRPPEIQKMLQEQRQQKGRRNHEEEFLLEAMAEEQESGVYYNDVWRVNLKDVVQSIASRKEMEKPADPTAPPPRVIVALWEHVKAAGKGMVPARSGFTAGMYKERVFFFGGVCDNDEYDSDEDEEDDESGDQLVGDSMFFNELLQFNIVKQKWFPTKMKEKKGGAAAAAESIVPSVRYGTQSTVLGSDLYLFGGMVEKQLNTRKSTVIEVTYDDLYRLSLSKLDGFTMILPPSTKRAAKTAAATSTPASSTPAAEKSESKASAPAEKPKEEKAAAPPPAAEAAAASAAVAAEPEEEEEEGEEEDAGDDDEEVEVVPDYIVDVSSPSSSSDEDGEDEDGDDDDGEDDGADDGGEKPAGDSDKAAGDGDKADTEKEESKEEPKAIADEGKKE